jgi:hypothetical protein
MSGLVCGVCGIPWKLDKPLLYHLGALHCPTFDCSRECAECKDDFEAIGDGPPPTAQNVGTSEQVPTKRAPPDGSFTKAPGYAAMMAKLKGGGGG